MAARLLLSASELGNSHLSLRLLLHGKGWVLKPLPVVWSQGGADGPCKEGMSSLKKAPFVFCSSFTSQLCVLGTMPAGTWSPW